MNQKIIEREYAFYVLENRKMTTSTQELVSELEIIKTALGYITDYLDSHTTTPEQQTGYLIGKEENHAIAYLTLHYLHRLIEDNR